MMEPLRSKPRKSRTTRTAAAPATPAVAPAPVVPTVVQPVTTSIVAPLSEAALRRTVTPEQKAARAQTIAASRRYAAARIRAPAEAEATSAPLPSSELQPEPSAPPISLMEAAQPQVAAPQPKVTAAQPSVVQVGPTQHRAQPSLGARIGAQMSFVNMEQPAVSQVYAPQIQEGYFSRGGDAALQMKQREAQRTRGGERVSGLAEGLRAVAARKDAKEKKKREAQKRLEDSRKLKERPTYKVNYTDDLNKAIYVKRKPLIPDCYPQPVSALGKAQGKENVRLLEELRKLHNKMKGLKVPSVDFSELIVSAKDKELEALAKEKVETGEEAPKKKKTILPRLKKEKQPTDPRMEEMIADIQQKLASGEWRFEKTRLKWELKTNEEKAVPSLEIAGIHNPVVLEEEQEMESDHTGTGSVDDEVLEVVHRDEEETTPLPQTSQGEYHLRLRSQQAKASQAARTNLREDISELPSTSKGNQQPAPLSLINLGTDCFMNAGTNLLYNIDPLRDVLSTIRSHEENMLNELSLIFRGNKDVQDLRAMLSGLDGEREVAEFLEKIMPSILKTIPGKIIAADCADCRSEDNNRDQVHYEKTIPYFPLEGATLEEVLNSNFAFCCGNCAKALENPKEDQSILVRLDRRTIAGAPNIELPLTSFDIRGRKWRVAAATEIENRRKIGEPAIAGKSNGHYRSWFFNKDGIVVGDDSVVDYVPSAMPLQNYDAILLKPAGAPNEVRNLELENPDADCAIISSLNLLNQMVDMIKEQIKRNPKALLSKCFEGNGTKIWDKLLKDLNIIRKDVEKNKKEDGKLKLGRKKKDRKVELVPEEEDEDEDEDEDEELELPPIMRKILEAMDKEATKCITFKRTQKVKCGCGETEKTTEETLLEVCPQKGKSFEDSFKVSTYLYPEETCACCEQKKETQEDMVEIPDDLSRIIVYQWENGEDYPKDKGHILGKRTKYAFLGENWVLEAAVVHQETIGERAGTRVNASEEEDQDKLDDQITAHYTTIVMQEDDTMVEIDDKDVIEKPTPRNFHDAHMLLFRRAKKLGEWPSGKQQREKYTEEDHKEAFPDEWKTAERKPLSLRNRTLREHKEKVDTEPTDGFVIAGINILFQSDAIRDAFCYRDQKNECGILFRGERRNVGKLRQTLPDKLRTGHHDVQKFFGATMDDVVKRVGGKVLSANCKKCKMGKSKLPTVAVKGKSLSDALNKSWKNCCKNCTENIKAPEEDQCIITQVETRNKDIPLPLAPIDILGKNWVVGAAIEQLDSPGNYKSWAFHKDAIFVGEDFKVKKVDQADVKPLSSYTHILLKPAGVTDVDEAVAGLDLEAANLQTPAEGLTDAIQKVRGMSITQGGQAVPQGLDEAISIMGEMQLAPGDQQGSSTLRRPTRVKTFKTTGLSSSSGRFPFSRNLTEKAFVQEIREQAEREAPPLVEHGRPLMLRPHLLSGQVRPLLLPDRCQEAALAPQEQRQPSNDEELQEQEQPPQQPQESDAQPHLVHSTPKRASRRPETELVNPAKRAKALEEEEEVTVVKDTNMDKSCLSALLNQMKHALNFRDRARAEGEAPEDVTPKKILQKLNVDDVPALLEQLRREEQPKDERLIDFFFKKVVEALGEAVLKPCELSVTTEAPECTTYCPTPPSRPPVHAINLRGTTKATLQEAMEEKSAHKADCGHGQKTVFSHEASEFVFIKKDKDREFTDIDNCFESIVQNRRGIEMNGSKWEIVSGTAVFDSYSGTVAKKADGTWFLHTNQDEMKITRNSVESHYLQLLLLKKKEEKKEKEKAVQEEMEDVIELSSDSEMEDVVELSSDDDAM